MNVQFRIPTSLMKRRWQKSRNNIDLLLQQGHGHLHGRKLRQQEGMWSLCQEPNRLFKEPCSRKLVSIQTA
jgi:hypothetical protein